MYVKLTCRIGDALHTSGEHNPATHPDQHAVFDYAMIQQRVAERFADDKATLEVLSGDSLTALARCQPGGRLL